MKNLEKTFIPEQSDKLLNACLAYIDENLTRIENVSDVAKAVFASDSYVYQIFRKKLGKSPKRYIRDGRLTLAKYYIEKGESPSSVYLKCGFKDYSSFFRAYKKLFGFAPTCEDPMLSLL